VELQIADVRNRLAGRRLGLELTEAACVLIAREGYDPVYGARPLRRFIQREVETRIGRALIAGEIADGATITIDAEQDELIVRWREAEAEEPTERVTVAA
jgi:ATP-dependent Clp protease ATP-binding subunit ClpB